MPSLFEIAILIAAGILSGFINALASSGSTVTLPLLLFLGLPPTIANATNRMPIMAGSLMAMYNFNQSKMINWRKALIITIPVVLGTVTGVIIASLLPGKVVGVMITIAVIIAMILILSNVRSLLTKKGLAEPRMRWFHYIVFYFIGLWSGLIVLDAASLILLGLVLGVGFELLHANAIKNYLLFVISFLSVVIFGFEKEMNWTIAFILSAGSIFGAYLGSKFAQRESAKIWIYRILLTIVAVEIVQLVFRVANSK